MTDGGVPCERALWKCAPFQREITVDYGHNKAKDGIDAIKLCSSLQSLEIIDPSHPSTKVLF